MHVFNCTAFWLCFISGHSFYLASFLSNVCLLTALVSFMFSFHLPALSHSSVLPTFFTFFFFLNSGLNFRCFLWFKKHIFFPRNMIEDNSKCSSCPIFFFLYCGFTELFCLDLYWWLLNTKDNVTVPPVKENAILFYFCWGLTSNFPPLLPLHTSHLVAW